MTTAHVILLIGRIEGCEQIAFLHFAADVHIASGNAPCHSKTQHALITRLDIASETPEILHRFGLCFNEHYRSYGLGRCFFLATATQQKAAQQQA
ncbi:hypothetical protein ALP29_201700 [Pseudomonas syringae pv. avii]|uniref:Uncharacterized protein n=1 Tax=Pseudomonas syringae pv. avii TaxID=663959 RepID=A0A3M5VQ29_PSESX|nr:hypothetical protein ALP29_201700 [Pseudomonas syringae pv. avii]